MQLSLHGMSFGLSARAFPLTDTVVMMASGSRLQGAAVMIFRTIVARAAVFRFLAFSFRLAVAPVRARLPQARHHLAAGVA